VLPLVLAEVAEERDPNYLTALPGVLGNMRCKHNIELTGEARALVKQAATRVLRSRKSAMYHAARAADAHCDGPIPR
jgi:hypothetical protein